MRTKTIIVDKYLKVFFRPLRGASFDFGSIFFGPFSILRALSVLNSNYFLLLFFSGAQSCRLAGFDRPFKEGSSTQAGPQETGPCWSDGGDLEKYRGCRQRNARPLQHRVAQNPRQVGDPDLQIIGRSREQDVGRSDCVLLDRRRGRIRLQTSCPGAVFEIVQDQICNRLLAIQNIDRRRPDIFGGSCPWPDLPGKSRLIFNDLTAMGQSKSNQC